MGSDDRIEEEVAELVLTGYPGSDTSDPYAEVSASDYDTGYVTKYLSPADLRELSSTALKVARLIEEATDDDEDDDE